MGNMQKKARKENASKGYRTVKSINNTGNGKAVTVIRKGSAADKTYKVFRNTSRRYFANSQQGRRTAAVLPKASQKTVSRSVGANTAVSFVKDKMKHPNVAPDVNKKVQASYQNKYRRPKGRGAR